MAKYAWRNGQPENQKMFLTWFGGLERTGSLTQNYGTIVHDSDVPVANTKKIKKRGRLRKDSKREYDGTTALPILSYLLRSRTGLGTILNLKLGTTLNLRYQ